MKQQAKNGSKRRVISFVSASAIVISSMIGTGIFTTTGLMAEMNASGGDIILAWLIGGIVALCGALCYGEIGASLPESGGEYHYLSRLIHPSLGFISGWVSLVVGFAAPVAAAAIAMHLFIGKAFPGWNVQLMAVLTIFVVSLLHAYDIRLGSKVQTALIAIKILLLCGFIFFILPFNFSFAVDSLTEINSAFWFSSSFAVVLIFVSFAYSGWNASAYIGAEIRKPEKNLPRSLLAGTGIVTVVYLLVNLAFLSVVPLKELAGVEEVAYLVGTKQWGDSAGFFISLLIGLGQIVPISAMMIIGPRVAEAMSRDGFLPKRLGKLNQRKVPASAVLLQAVLASLFALTSSFGTLLIYIGFTLNIFAALTVVSLFRLRKEGISKHQVCIGYPVTPIIFIIFALWTTVWSIFMQPFAALAGIATMVIGYLAYFYQTRKKDYFTNSESEIIPTD